MILRIKSKTNKEEMKVAEKNQICREGCEFRHEVAECEMAMMYPRDVLCMVEDWRRRCGLHQCVRGH